MFCLYLRRINKIISFYNQTSMKKDCILPVMLLVFLNLITFSKHSVSQTNCFQWVSQIDNGFYDNVLDIAVDDESNIYGMMAGIHEFTFADTTVFPTSATNCCFFKLDSNGVFQWAKLNYISCSYYDWIKSHTIIIDQNQQPIILGSFTDTCFLEDTILVGSTFPYNHMFFARYDKDGNVLTAKQLSHEAISDYGGAIGMDAWTDDDNNLYTTGYFWNTVYFGNDSLVMRGINSTDIFTAKYDSMGNYLWVRQGGSDTYYDSGTTGGRVEIGYAITGDNENIYITGRFFGTAWFDNDSLVSYGGADIFLAKYNHAGQLQWLRHAGGPIDDAPSDTGYDITIDSDNNLICTGHFLESAIFGKHQIYATGYDAFIASYSSEGEILWVNKFGQEYSDRSYSVVCTDPDNIYVTGVIQSVLFPGNREIFLIKYNSVGMLVDAMVFGGNSYNYGIKLANNSQSVFHAGTFQDETQFCDTTLTPLYGADMFIARLNTDILSSTALQTPMHQGYNIFPNPGNNTVNILLPNVRGIVRIEMYNLSGQRIISRDANIGNSNNLIKLNTGNIPKGLYIINISSEEQSFSAKYIRK